MGIRRERQQLERRTVEIVEAWNQFAARTIIGVSTGCQPFANRLGHPLSVPTVPALSEPSGWRYRRLKVAPAIGILHRPKQKTR